MRTVSLLFHDVYAADPRESGFRSPGADRYKLSLRQFDAQLAGLAQVRADAPMLVQDISGGMTTSGYRSVELTGGPKVAGGLSPTGGLKVSGYRDGNHRD